MKPAAWLLITVSPFAILEPLAYWAGPRVCPRLRLGYLGLAVTMAL
jgi:hypothetical protein